MEKNEVYLKLYKIQWERYDQIRNFEWKVTIGLWAAIGFMAHNFVGKLPVSNNYFLIIIHIAVFIVYSIWHWGGYYANIRNSYYAMGYLEK